MLVDRGFRLGSEIDFGMLQLRTVANAAFTLGESGAEVAFLGMRRRQDRPGSGIVVATETVGRVDLLRVRLLYRLGSLRRRIRQQ